MASQFYNRYVPLSSKLKNGDASDHAAKRRKVARPEENSLVEPGQPAHNVGQVTASEHVAGQESSFLLKGFQGQESFIRENSAQDPSADQENVDRATRAEEKAAKKARKKGKKDKRVGESIKDIDQTKKDEEKAQIKARKKAKKKIDPQQPDQINVLNPASQPDSHGDEYPTQKTDQSETPAEKKAKKKSKKRNHAESTTVDAENVLESAQKTTKDEIEPDEQESKYTRTRSKYENATENSAEVREQDVVARNEILVVPDDQAPIEAHGLQPLPQPPQKEDSPRVSTFFALPEWLRKPMLVSDLDTTPFADLAIHDSLLATLTQKGYTKAFAIQSALLPMLLPGDKNYSGDICVSAATGSGKTLAYALPIVENLRGKPSTMLRGLIIVPTRELVTQASETLEMCGAGSGLKIGTAVGSKSLKEEQQLLINRGQRYDPAAYQAEREGKAAEEGGDFEGLDEWDFEDGLSSLNMADCFYNHVYEYKSKVDVLICTPGRLVDHIQSTKGFTLEHVQWLVVDEADRLLDESFQQWVDTLLPKLEEVQPLSPRMEQLSRTFNQRGQRRLRKIILSATMTRDVGKLTTLKLRRPRLVVLQRQKKVDSSGDVAEAIESDAANVGGREQLELPSTLQETAISVKNSEEKPLYLIEIVENGVSLAQERRPKQLNEDLTHIRLAHDEEEEDQASSDDQLTSDSMEASSPSENSDSSRTVDNIPTLPVGEQPEVTPAPNSEQPSSLISKATVAPNEETDAHGTLIFTNNNENAQRLARLLSILRPNLQSQISTLTKSIASSSGHKILAAFRKHKLSILIASDRASRGLDIQDLAHVINYDMPTSLTSYIHRVGRTARAGKGGMATTLVADHQARWFWNEIARSKMVVRGPGRSVVRAKLKREIAEEARGRYGDALAVLGDEVRGKKK